MKYIKLFEDFEPINDNRKKHIDRIISSLKKQYQMGMDIYNALMSDSGEKSIERRRQDIDSYFDSNKDIDLKSIAKGTREISDSQSSKYYIGAIMIYLDKTAFRAGFYNALGKKEINFNDWYEGEMIESIIDKISEFLITNESIPKS